MRPVGIEAIVAACALGDSPDSLLSAALSPRLSPMTLMPLLGRGGDALPCGAVTQTLDALPSRWAGFECRNHRLAYRALRSLLPAIETWKSRVGPQRLGIVVGSSTSGVDASEAAFLERHAGRPIPPGYRYESQHEMGSLAQFVAAVTGITGPAFTVSTACSSSAKAFITAASLLDMGLCSAVIAGGSDALCQLTLNGFDALASLSSRRCNPLSANRDGLNIGEGAAFFLLTRQEAPVLFLGAGESDDAHHMNAPHPEGLGAEAAMRSALRDSGLSPRQVGYVNLHGTATPLNDAMESKALARVFGDGVLVSSTKPLTGHALGAAGAIEAALVALALQNPEGAFPPPHHWDGVADEALPRLPLVLPGASARVDGAWLSSSFAFGGSNCVLAFGRPR